VRKTVISLGKSGCIDESLSAVPAPDKALIKALLDNISNQPKPTYEDCFDLSAGAVTDLGDLH
jgi:hypothetical protein